MNIYRFRKDLESAQKIYGGEIKIENGWLILEHNKYKKPKEKVWRGMKVDIGISNLVLERLNSNPNIRIVGTCSGHNHPSSASSVYLGNMPQIHFVYNGNMRYIFNEIQKIPHFKVEYSGKDIRGENIYSIFGNTKGTQLWWNKAAKIIENIKFVRTDGYNLFK